MALRGLLAGSLLRRAAAGVTQQAAAAGAARGLLETLSPAAAGLAAAAQQPGQAALPACAAAATALLHRRPLTTSAASAAAAQPAVAEDEPAAQLGAIPIEQQEEQGLYRDLQVPLLDLSASRVGTYTLGGDIFDVPIRRDILHRVVRWQLAKRQQGTHHVKTRSDVRGGGRKPRPQKGSGKSRQGTIRAPQWRGGGKAHGPVVRSHAHDLPKRVRRLGLQCALSAKAWERRLVVLDRLAVPSGKTKDMLAAVDALLAGAPRRSALLCDSSKEGEDGGELMRRGAANIPWVDCIPQQGLNTYSILQRDYLLLTRSAADLLAERLRRPIRPGRKSAL